MRFGANALVARILTVVAWLLVPLALASQNPPQSQPIRVATRLVQIGVIVRDKNGLVSNLTKNDFAVLDRGTPQEISLFSVESGTSVSQPPQPLPRNTFSDLPQYAAAKPRSVTIVLLDNLNTLYGSAPESKYEATPVWVEGLALQRAKTHLIEFIKTLYPRDLVAIYGLRDSLRVLCDFTNDRAQLLAIVTKYDTSAATNRAVVEPGRRTAPDFDGRPDPVAVGFENEGALALAGMANEARDAETLAALQSIADHVANIPGRKNLVWLTANIPFSGAAMARVLSPANIAVYPVDARGLLARNISQQYFGTADADEVSGAAGHFDNMPAQSSQPIGIATMQKLADETGGQAFVNTNDITGAIRKAVEDSAVTYTLGFYINLDSLDGKFHEVKVQAKRSGLTLRYPKGYFAFQDMPAGQNQNSTSLAAEVESPIESSTIPLQATVDRVEQPAPHSLKISCLIDARNVQLAPSGGLRKGAVEVYVIEQNQAGKVLFKSGKTFTLEVPERRYEALLKSGVLFHEYVQLKAETATLRILVEDPATAEVGSLIIPLSQIN